MNNQKIISLAQEIIHEASKSEENAISNFQIEVTESQIICTWDAHGTGEMDILYYAEGVHSVWQHSVRKYGHDVRIEDERFEISIGLEGIWHARALVDGEKQGEDTGSNIAEEETKLNVFTALWSSNSVPDNEIKQLMTAGHNPSPNYDSMKKVVDSGKKVIPSFGGFSPSHSDSQLRERVGWYTDTFEKIGWENIEFILLTDEPFLNNYTTHQTQVILDEAKRLYKAPVTFTFTRGAINTETLPTGLELVGINFYPLFEPGSVEGYPQIHNYTDFKSLFDSTLETARQKAPESEFVITAQVFGAKEGANIPWRNPEPESAEWYAKAITPDVVGLTFWGWKSNRWIGFSELPELQQAWIDVLSKH